MPSNKDFTMSVLVGGVELPEYTKDGTCFVESNLFTPVSYNVHLEEEVQGETEAQSWPVTPYQIRVAAKSNTPYSYYKIFVDGQKASQVAVHPGKQCISEGFYDGSQITEFLFSLPRFPKNEKDRIEKGKASRIGVLEVECWNSKVTGYKRPVTHNMEYSQANKKDSSNVTQGQYMMATTKMGRSLRTTQKSLVEDWTLFNVRSKLSVKYVMGHSLIDMGFKLKPIRIPIHRIPASVVHQPISVAKRKKPGPLSKKFPVPRSNIPVPVETEVIEIDSDDSDDVIVGDIVSSKKRKLENAIDVDESMPSEAEGTSGEVDIKTEAKEDGDKEAESKDDDSKSDKNEEKMETEGSQDEDQEKEAEDGDGKERAKEGKAAKSGDNSEAEAGGSGDGVNAKGKENDDEKGESEGKGDADSEKGEDGGNSDDKPADSDNSKEEGTNAGSSGDTPGERVDKNEGEPEAGGSGDAPVESEDSNKEGEAEAGESGDAQTEREDSSKEGEAGVNESGDTPAESVINSKEGEGESGESRETPDVPEESTSTSEVKGDEENTKEDDFEKSEDKQKEEDGDNVRKGHENVDDSNGQNDNTENKESENTDMKCSDDNILDIDLFCALNDIDDNDHNDAGLLD